MNADIANALLAHPQKPTPPIGRLIREGCTDFCIECGSSMAHAWFWQKSKGCIQPKCKNYYI